MKKSNANFARYFERDSLNAALMSVAAESIKCMRTASAFNVKSVPALMTNEAIGWLTRIVLGFGLFRLIAGATHFAGAASDDGAGRQKAAGELASGVALVVMSGILFGVRTALSATLKV